MVFMPDNSITTSGVPVSSFAKDLSLVETLRVLEVARGLRQEREVAEVALARDEIRTLMRKRLMDAAIITGDKITEADVDAAIEQYFATQHTYQDPPLSFSVLMAHLWVRRFSVLIIISLILVVWVVFSWLF
jgi:predicted nucleic-acid-binding protein